MPEGDCGEWGSEPGGAGDQEKGRANAAEAGGSIVNRKRGASGAGARGWGEGEEEKGNALGLQLRSQV